MSAREPTADRPAASPAQAERFDAWASDYDAGLAQGISLSGEDKLYFARGRLLWLRRRLTEQRVRIARVLDFGCGVGTAVPLFFELLGAESVVGVDISEQSLAIARDRYGSLPARFVPLREYRPSADVDLAFCNGVFHHIPPVQRAEAVRIVRASLRPAGWFALCDNNPWNPGARLVMKRIPFDRDAIPLSARQCRRLLRGGGFDIVSTDHLFIFPRLLRWLRGLEAPLAGLPLGAQYLVLARCSSGRSGSP